MGNELAGALAEAKLLERETGAPHYVVRCHDRTYVVTPRAPLIGAWWSSDGIKHG